MTKFDRWLDQRHAQRDPPSWVVDISLWIAITVVALTGTGLLAGGMFLLSCFR
jgi:antibiotic biosynthesis monooxygenase (ABM) superfamily enzyme